MTSRGRIKVRYAVLASCLLLVLAGQLRGRVSGIAGASSSAMPSSVASGMAAEPYPPPTSLCISDALANTDFVYNRAGTTPPCSVFTTGNFFDAYTFTVSGCAPATVTVSTCTGPCGVQTALDTVVFVYQKPGGAAATPADPILKPANPCTNLIASSNNFCGLSSQVTTTLQTTAGSGDFVVVVTSNLTGQTGPYNLNVSSPTCTIVQQPATCVYVLSPTDQSFQAAGGADTVTVTAGATCSWTAVSNDSFIHVTSGASGTGNGAVGYSVDANGGGPRIGTMTIAGQTFTVTQEAGAVSLPCIRDALVTGNSFVRPSAANPISCPQNPPNPTVFYKAYEVTLSGCPSGIVTASTCGASPCSPPAGTLADTILFIYRKPDGSASSPGSPIFNPASPCTNAVVGNNNFAACGTLSQITTALNAGSFVVVVTSNGASQTGTFNLSLTAPGCTLGQCPTITGTVSGGETICAGGSSTVSVTVSGGAPPYTVTLSNGGGTQTGSSPLSFVVSPSSTTTYSVTTATDSAGCPANATGSATVTVNPAPTTATVGGPQSICAFGTTSGLGGNAPVVGTGSWSVVSGGTGSFNPDATTPNATFTHTSGAGPIVVRWTISNPPCADSSADVAITISQPPTAANAGPDQSVCGSSTTLAANAPAAGTGTWSVISGSGTFADSHDPTTTVSGLSVGSNVLRWTITNGACPPSFDDATITSASATTVSALGNADVWVGLKNSDDVGTKFDFLAEVLKNGVVIGSGQINDQPGGSSGFNNAILRTIGMALSSPENFCIGNTLSFRLSVRVAASSGHVSGTARLWFNDNAANSRFTATVNGTPTDYFLLDGFLLGASAGPGPKKTIDVLVNRNVGGNPFKPFGTWSKTF